jgi:hypothetical protein
MTAIDECLLFGTDPEAAFRGLKSGRGQSQITDIGHGREEGGGRRTSNIERPTSNVEVKRKRLKRRRSACEADEVRPMLEN